MPTAVAHVGTDRPERYLGQLCKHFGNKGRHLGHRPRAHHGGATPMPVPAGLRPDQIRVDRSDTDGTLELPWGRCTLQARPGELVLRAEAEDEQHLRHLQDLLATHLDRFGRRDRLTVDWQRTDDSEPRPGEHSRTPAPHTPARRTHLVWAGIALLVAAVLAAHAGLVEAVLSAFSSGPRGSGWVVAGILLVVLVKVTALTALGRRIHRRHRRPPAAP